MGLIQCAENCKYQKDGYCYLEKCSKIESVENDCPYFVPNIKNLELFNNRNGLF